MSNLTWNATQRKIYAHFKEGLTFTEIVKKKLPKSTTSQVMHAMEEGDAPPEPEPGSGSDSGFNVSIAGVSTQSRNVLTFRVGQQVVPIFPEDLLICHDHFRDLQSIIGWESDFSSTVREGMKMLRTILVQFKPQEVNDGNGTGG